jgi:PIN domain nuclease of toxin-antitoxin system
VAIQKNYALSLACPTAKEAHRFISPLQCITSNDQPQILPQSPIRSPFVAITNSQRGKLTLPEPPEKYVVARLARHRIQALPVQVSHALRVGELPALHRNPFDRLLIAQSQMEGLPILNADENLRRYPVETTW